MQSGIDTLKQITKIVGGVADVYGKIVEKSISEEAAWAAEPPRVEVPPPRVEDVEEEEDLPNLAYESNTDSESEDKEETNKPHRRIVSSSKPNAVASEEFPKSTPLSAWM